MYNGQFFCVRCTNSIYQKLILLSRDKFYFTWQYCVGNSLNNLKSNQFYIDLGLFLLQFLHLNKNNGGLSTMRPVGPHIAPLAHHNNKYVRKMCFGGWWSTIYTNASKRGCFIHSFPCLHNSGHEYILSLFSSCSKTMIYVFPLASAFAMWILSFIFIFSVVWLGVSQFVTSGLSPILLGLQQPFSRFYLLLFTYISTFLAINRQFLDRLWTVITLIFDGMYLFFYLHIL